MLARWPSYSSHLGILSHDRDHGDPEPLLWGPISYLNMWVALGQREWLGVDVLVAGSNPLLGAILSAGFSKMGLSCLWLVSKRHEGWDYPLTLKGEHDDLLTQAGLPGVSRKLFDVLGASAQRSVSISYGMEIQYIHRPIGSANSEKTLAFAKEEDAPPTPVASFLRLENWRDNGFAGCHRHIPRIKRGGGGQRQQIIESNRLVLISDVKDGTNRQSRIETISAGSRNDMGGHAVQARLGRARWHESDALSFAARSREDIKLALKHGGWV